MEDFQPISKEAILMGREVEFPLSALLTSNLEELLIRINKFAQEYYDYSRINLIVNSGYRPGRYNIKAGGSETSPHLYCQAIDLHDEDGKIKKFIAQELSILDRCDLYQEHPSRTITWAHLDERSRINRIFIP